jgi:glycerate-2-kinase
MDLFDFIKNTIQNNFKNELQNSINNSIENAVYSNINVIRNYKNIYIISVGKASLSMYNALIHTFEKYKLSFNKALVIYDINLKDQIKDLEILENNKKIELIESTHPLVSENSFKAAKKIIDLILEFDNENSLFLFLISGGSSSMVEDSIIPPITLAEIYKILLQVDFNIYKLNTYRTFLSNIKGGKLLQYFNKSKIISFIISDVPFNSVDTIGSGLTTFYKKLSYQEMNQLISELSEYLKILIDSKMLLNIINKNKEIEKIMENKLDCLKGNLHNFVLLDNFESIYLLYNQMKNLKEYYKLNVKNKGFEIEIVSTHINLDIINLTKFFKSFIFTKLNEYLKGNIKEKIKVYLFGGETYLKVLKNGYGGRLQHLVLYLIKELYYLLINQFNIDELKNKVDILFFSLATDGKDGNTDKAGVILPIFEFFNKDISKVEKYLDNFNSGIFFDNPKNNKYLINLPYGLINLNEIYGIIFDFKDDIN